MSAEGNKKSGGVKTAFKLIHGLICTLLLLVGLAILGYSIYLVATNQSFLPDLNYENNGFINAVLSTAIAGIIIGAAIIVLSIVGMITFARGCCGVLFGIIYTILMIALLAVLIFVAVITLKFATNKQGQSLENIFKKAWQSSVNNNDFNQSVCKLQSDFKCQGFDDNDCAQGCTTTGTEAQRKSTCSPKQQSLCALCPKLSGSNSSGCYNAIVDKYSKFYLPVGIVASVAGGLVVVDLLAVWVL